MKTSTKEPVGGQESLRQVNLSRVLTSLRLNAPVSRAALAEITGLNRATISRLVRELIEHGLVRETGLRSVRTGRPSILLQLNPQAGCIIGVELEAAFGAVILTDLSAHVLWRQEAGFGQGTGPDAFLESAAGLVRQACEQAGELHCQVLGLGVSLPGLVASPAGVLLFAPEPGWAEVPVRQRLEGEFSIPIFIDNKSNMAALAESCFGSGQGSDCILYIDLSAAIGAGIVLDQRLMLGASGLAGEVGHMTIDPGGPACPCGSRGCWETYVSAPAVVRRVGEAVRAGVPTGLDEAGRLTVAQIAGAARAGDPAALAALRETGFYLGVGLAGLINTFNPEKVVLGGYFTQAYEFLLPVIRQTLQERALRWPLQAAEILAATYVRDAGLMGAVAAVYRQILSNPDRAFKTGQGHL